MAKNTLAALEPRLGHLYDQNSSTPDASVMLRNTGESILLVMTIEGLCQPRGAYSSWWMPESTVRGTGRSGDTKAATPKELQFIDVNGPVTLVGCRAGKCRQGKFFGQGEVVAEHAILGARHPRYSLINGLRTEFPALLAWTAMQTMTVTTEKNHHGLLSKVGIEVESRDPVHLSRSLNLELRSLWETTGDSLEMTIREPVATQTEVRTPRPWNEHLELHLDILHLVALAAWEPFGFSKVSAMRDDDPQPRPGRERPVPRWAEVVTHSLPKHTSSATAPRLLFHLDDIGPAGVRKWLKLRRQFESALSPVIDILYSEHIWGTSSLVQSGIALESVGYVIERDQNNGARFNKKGWMTFPECLKAIIADTALLPVEDPARWETQAHDCYNATKHANRPLPDLITQMNVLRENILVLRYWLAGRLGIPAETLQDRLQSDPLRRAFEERE